MVSETSICNQALTWLAAKTITSLDDNSREAIWMKNNYPFIRDAVLEERMWTFATARDTSTTADRDAWDQMYLHPKPEDWLSVFRVMLPTTSSPVTGANQSINRIDPTWRMEGGNVISAHTTVLLWGLKRISDTGAFSALFVQALAARLASEAAIALTENRQLQVDMWGLYGDKLREAAVRDGQQLSLIHI